MQTKAFSFPYNDYTVMALAYLYLDGTIKDVEIEAIWHKGKDLMEIYRREGRWDPYVRAWMKQTISAMKLHGAERLQHLLMDAAGIYYEYDFL